MHPAHYGGRRRRPVIEDEDSVSAKAVLAVLAVGLILAVAL